MLAARALVPIPVVPRVAEGKRESKKLPPKETYSHALPFVRANDVCYNPSVNPKIRQSLQLC